MVATRSEKWLFLVIIFIFPLNFLIYIFEICIIPVQEIEQFYFFLRYQIIGIFLLFLIAIYRYVQHPREEILRVLPTTIRLLAGSLLFLAAFAYAYIAPDAVVLDNDDPKVLGGGHTVLFILMTICATISAAPIAGMAVMPTKLEKAVIANNG